MKQKKLHFSLSDVVDVILLYLIRNIRIMAPENLTEVKYIRRKIS